MGSAPQLISNFGSLAVAEGRSDILDLIDSSHRAAHRTNGAESVLGTLTTDRAATTLLFEALIKRQFAVVEHLVTVHGADIDQRDANGMTPFLWWNAYGDDDPRRLRWLVLELNADPTLTSPSGWGGDDYARTDAMRAAVAAFHGWTGREAVSRWWSLMYILTLTPDVDINTSSGKRESKAARIA